MKKIGLMTCSAAMLFATSTAQVKFNVFAGINTTTNHISEKVASTPAYNSQTGFVIGGNMSKRLFKSSWSETGLSYNLRRYGYRATLLPDYSTDVDFRIGYLSLSQLFLVKVKGKHGWSISTGTGFFAGFPMHGRYTISNKSNGGTELRMEELDFGNSNTDQFKQVDAGANLLLRIQVKKIFLNVLYSHSLTDHVPADYNNSYKERFRGFSFALGYEF